MFQEGEVRETGANNHVERNRISEETGNSLPKRQNFRAVFHIFFIADVKYVIQEIEKNDNERIVLRPFPPWHASHALRREYTTVLHSHKSVLKASPYVPPGERAAK